MGSDMNLKETLVYGKNYLKQCNIGDSDIIAKVLVAYVFKIEKDKLILHYEDEIKQDSFNEYKKIIEKIVNGIPLQYITNNQDFMNMNFYVDENVLIPQPDTEILVQEVIDVYKGRTCKILDLCTGSGAIGIALAKYIDNSSIIACDISTKAIQIAKLNAERNLVHKKMKFFCSDMFENINDRDFDIIVSNPPYIESNVIDTLDRQVKNEPHIALDGGKDGLDFYRIIASNAYKYLKDSGKIFLEIGYNQKDAVINILNQSGHYDDIYSKKDYGGNDRIIVSTARR